MLITVLPVNDDPPYFNPAIYFPSVIENAAPGESVVTVKAHNPSSDGSNLLYSIKSGNEAGRFAIDRKSGLITTTTSLDREEQDKYELEVKVSNGDNPPKSAYITFPVTVADANDNGPYFLKSFYDVYFKQQDDPSTSVEILRFLTVEFCWGFIMLTTDVSCSCKTLDNICQSVCHNKFMVILWQSTFIKVTQES